MRLLIDEISKLIINDKEVGIEQANIIINKVLIHADLIPKPVNIEVNFKHDFYNKYNFAIIYFNHHDYLDKDIRTDINKLHELIRDNLLLFHPQELAIVSPQCRYLLASTSRDKSVIINATRGEYSFEEFCTDLKRITE